MSFLAEHRNIERETREGSAPSFDLDTMRRATDLLNHPHEAVPLIHVAGTKGKGSVCLMLEAFLFGVGYTPAAFLSPHLIDLRERLRFDREPVSRREFVRLLNDLHERLSTKSVEQGVMSELTYFEWLTLMAFALLEREEVDVGLLEAGMGGRLDSTNVVTPAVSVITALGLDHEEILGSTIDDIAAEKAGIIKSEVPVVTGAKGSQGLEVILDRADELDAPTRVLGRDFSIVERVPQGGSGTGQKVVLELADSDQLDFHLSVPGRHQAENLAVAVQAASLFVERQDGLWNQGVVGSSARQLSLPGRFQMQQRRPPVILDAAHNPMSCEALVDALEETNFTPPRTLLFGTAADKDWRGMLRLLTPAFSRIILTGYDHDRAVDPARMREWYQDEFPGSEPETANSPVQAVQTFIGASDREHPLVVVGSFYLVGQVLKGVEDDFEEHVSQGTS